MLTRIKDVRIKKGISQKELAERTGITQASISYIEAGKRPIDLDLLSDIAKILDCKPYELLPLDWQPQVSEEDLKLLNAIKSFTANKENEEKAQNPQKQNENER